MQIRNQGSYLKHRLAWAWHGYTASCDADNQDSDSLIDDILIDGDLRSESIFVSSTPPR